MVLRHVRRHLSAYMHDELPADRRGRVEKHLAACRSCAKALEEVRLGIRLAEALPPAGAPDTLWPAIESRLGQPAASGAGVSPRGVSGPAARRWRWGYGVAGMLVLCTGGLVWYLGTRERLHLVGAGPSPSPLETLAVREHDHRTRGGSAFDLETDDLSRIRDWVRSGTGLSASIPDRRPPEDAGRFHFAGASLARVGSATAAVIGFEIDATPITLVTARLEDLAEPPREGRFSKDVAFRSDPDRGYKVLTWGSDGQAYVLVSTLPGYGQQACFVCHTAPERRALIRDARLGTR